MAAIAVSKEEEEKIEKLRKELRIPTKAGVIRAALKTLEKKVEEVKSVRRCAAADKLENQELFPGRNRATHFR